MTQLLLPASKEGARRARTMRFAQLLDLTFIWRLGRAFMQLLRSLPVGGLTQLPGRVLRGRGLRHVNMPAIKIRQLKKYATKKTGDFSPVNKVYRYHLGTFTLSLVPYACLLVVIPVVPSGTQAFHTSGSIFAYHPALIILAGRVAIQQLLLLLLLLQLLIL